MIRQVLHQEYEMANETKRDRDNPAFSRFDDKSPEQLEVLAGTLRDQAGGNVVGNSPRCLVGGCPDGAAPTIPCVPTNGNR